MVWLRIELLHKGRRAGVAWETAREQVGGPSLSGESASLESPYWAFLFG